MLLRKELLTMVKGLLRCLSEFGLGLLVYAIWKEIAFRDRAKCDGFSREEAKILIQEVLNYEEETK